MINSVQWKSPSELIPSPKNPNKHPEKQIERLAEIIRYQGFRSPIIVSNRTGHIVVGHGRLEAAKKLGLTTVPVSYQDFTDWDQEYAYMVADNAIAEWAELDLGQINAEIPNLGPLDINLLGIKDFNLDPPMFEPGTEDDQGKLDQKQMTQCPKCSEVFDHAKNKFEG